MLPALHFIRNAPYISGKYLTLRLVIFINNGPPGTRFTFHMSFILPMISLSWFELELN